MTFRIPAGVMTLNDRQRAALRLLQQDKRRDVYETALASNPRVGSGRYCVTYNPGNRIELSTREVVELVTGGYLTRRYPDAPDVNAFVLASDNFFL